MHSAPFSQNEVLEFLGSPASSGGAPVKRIDTHAASVFLSGSRALKIKRAVKFPFLDYSSLELRKQACLAEIEVNRPFAPEIYIGIARITRERDGSLRVGGEGEVVEWAVEMQRFDDTLTLDRYVGKNEITAEMAEVVVRRLAEVHRSAPRQPAAPWLGALRSYIEQHDKVFADHKDLIAPERAAVLRQKSLELLRNCEPLIARRADQGLLVRGHGDLHLGNIALIKGAPVIFDAIEFDPLIAAGDVFYDLAFFIMDLVAHGQLPAANAALNGYLAFSARQENLEGLRLLPLVLGVRAAIRAIVHLAKFDQAKQQHDADVALKYFDHAIGFVKPREPVLIAIGGLSGTGKSHLAKRLAPHVAPHPGAVVLRSDVKRKCIRGVAPTVRLDASAYTPDATREVYEAIMADAAAALSAGHSAILDAVFSKPEERAAAENVARKAGVPFQGIYLHVVLATRIERVERRAPDPSDADRSVALSQESYDFGDTDWTLIDSSGTTESTLDAARKAAANILK